MIPYTDTGLRLRLFVAVARIVLVSPSPKGSRNGSLIRLDTDELLGAEETAEVIAERVNQILHPKPEFTGDHK